jgi:antitoxin VapB
MALNLKNQQVQDLAAEVSTLTGESKTEAIRKALPERRDRLRLQHPGDDRGGRLRGFLEAEVWPDLPRSFRGHAPSKAERERILGYGKEGV